MGRIHHLLVPVDMGDASAGALARAARLADEYSASVAAVHVLKPASRRAVDNLASGAADADDADDAAALCMDRLRAWVDEDVEIPSGAHLNLYIVEGAPAATIREIAWEQDADLIVMGRRRRSALLRVLAGSTTDDVVDSAPCPVLLVEPAPGDDATRLVSPADGIDEGGGLEESARKPL
jgi:nucleotide-binding universal stress UspA family protein